MRPTKKTAAKPRSTSQHFAATVRKDARKFGRLSPDRFARFADSESERQAAARDRLIAEAELQARRNRLLEERVQKFEAVQAERARARDAIQDRMFVDTAAIAAMRELIRGNNPERAASSAYDFAEALAAQRKLRIAKTAQA